MMVLLGRLKILIIVVLYLTVFESIGQRITVSDLLFVLYYYQIIMYFVNYIRFLFREGIVEEDVVSESLIGYTGILIVSKKFHDTI